MCLQYFGSAIVVFDGYRNPSTKYMTYQWCTGSKIGVEASFTEDMKLTTTKDIFLADVETNIISYFCGGEMWVYLQVQCQWMGICYPKETEWGWMEKDGNLVQIMTYLIHHPICYASSGVTVGQIATPRGAVAANITCSASTHAANVEVLGVTI